MPAMFTGNVNLLIAAAVLQDYLVDKDATPMSAGTVTCYHDNSRTTLKNWYYQSGTPGAYVYIALPNPLTLSAAGTICDANGVDTIPFFYPYSETDPNVRDAYYITVVNFAQTNQITRENFPFVGAAGGAVSTVATFNNLIINNGFWRNISPNYLNVTPYSTVALNSILQLNSATGLYNALVSPSQHDGFRLPDTQFLKNNTSTGTDVLTFTPFPLSNAQPIANTLVSEYYINHVCSANSGSGETTKCYQFPISLHLNTLANVPFTGSIQAQNGGSGAATLTISIFQDTGTGTTAPTPVQINQFTLTTAWQTYTFSGIFAATAGLSLGAGEDDAWYLQVGLPTDANFTINFTKPSIYLNANNVVPNYDFQTYDQIDPIINGARTGDMRMSLNAFYPCGWVPMNDGTIGSSASMANARANNDTWPLFSMLWNSFSSYNVSTTNPLAQMYNSAGSPIGYGANAFADFTANNAIGLTHTLGKVLMGTVPVGTLLALNKVAFTAAGNVITTGSNFAVFNGAPVYFPTPNASLPSGLTTGVVYYVANFNGSTTFNLATTFANAIGGSIISFGSGSGTINAKLTGSFTGENSHTLALNEMVNHTHTVNAGTGASATTASIATTNSAPITTSGINGYGSQTALNVTQPSVFFNMYIKL